jgi:hypothetical protein
MRALGVHEARVDTINWIRLGRSFISEAQLLSMADIMSIFLFLTDNQASCANQLPGTYWLVYRTVMTFSNSLEPSASSAGAEIKGWSAGQEDKLGSFLF